MSAPESGTGLAPNPYHPLAVVVGDPVVGEGTWVGPFAVLDGSGGLTIGAGCDISIGAQIYTHSSVRRCVSARAHPEVDRRPTVLGDHVFVGANAVVNMGVIVGDGAVVGAGAVVTGDVPPGAIVVGVPARIVGTVELDGDSVELVHRAAERGR